jgi:hypothetical protein
MDEYTFLIAAKLKADRLKLEREQRETTQPQQRTDDALQTQRPPSTRSFIPLFNWR